MCSVRQATHQPEDLTGGHNREGGVRLQWLQRFEVRSRLLTQSDCTLVWKALRRASPTLALLVKEKVGSHDEATTDDQDWSVGPSAVQWCPSLELTAIEGAFLPAIATG